MLASFLRRFIDMIIAGLFFLLLCAPLDPGGAFFTPSPASAQAGDFHRPSTATALPQSSMTFMPLGLLNYCGGFFDGFHDPASGWSQKQDEYVASGYAEGEFQVIGKQAGRFFLFRAPACDLSDYTLAVQARWAASPGGSYGLLFGIRGLFEQFYLFDVNTEFQAFRLLRREGAAFITVVPPTFTAAVYPGDAANQLTVIRQGRSLSLYSNGLELGTWEDAAITGYASVGLVSSTSSGQSGSEARFDNFSLSRLAGAPTGQTASISLRPAGSGSSLLQPVPAPPGW